MKYFQKFAFKFVIVPRQWCCCVMTCANFQMLKLLRNVHMIHIPHYMIYFLKRRNKKCNRCRCPGLSSVSEERLDFYESPRVAFLFKTTFDFSLFHMTRNIAVCVRLLLQTVTGSIVWLLINGTLGVGYLGCHRSSR